MHCKYNLLQFDVDVNKYAFQTQDYILPRLKILHSYVDFNTSGIQKKTLKRLIFSNVEDDLMEPFKVPLLTTKPCKCTWEFMDETDIIEIREIKKLTKLRQFIDKRLNPGSMKGLPRKLLVDLFISVIKFSFKIFLDNLQVCSLLAIFYNTHLYFTHNLWTMPEDVYKYFKEFLYFNCVNLLPLRTKIFEIKVCKSIALFFCNVYLKNLPLIRMLMLPNYGLYFTTLIPKEISDVAVKGKGKGKAKKKK